MFATPFFYNNGIEGRRVYWDSFKLLGLLKGNDSLHDITLYYVKHCREKGLAEIIWLQYWTGRTALITSLLNKISRKQIQSSLSLSSFWYLPRQPLFFFDRSLRSHSFPPLSHYFCFVKKRSPPPTDLTLSHIVLASIARLLCTFGYRIPRFPSWHHFLPHTAFTMCMTSCFFFDIQLTII